MPRQDPIYLISTTAVATDAEMRQLNIVLSAAVLLGLSSLPCHASETTLTDAHNEGVSQNVHNTCKKKEFFFRKGDFQKTMICLSGVLPLMIGSPSQKTELTDIYARLIDLAAKVDRSEMTPDAFSDELVREAKKLQHR